MGEPKLGYFEGTGGVRIAYRTWDVDAPRGSVVCVHGLGEHGGRYGRLAEVVARLDLATYAIDLRGHGRSRGRRGHVSDFSIFVRDLDRLRRHAISGNSGERTLFLVGHSLGGLVAGRYGETCSPGDLRGIVLVAPYLDIAMDVPGWKRKLGRVADRLVPSLTMDNGLDLEDLFRDEDARRAYADDPLVHRRISARLWGEMQRASKRLFDERSRLHVPVLFQLAGVERVVSNGASRRLAALLSTPARVLEYAGAFHALYHDPCAPASFEDLVRWLEDRLAPSSNPDGPTTGGPGDPTQT